MNFGLIFAGMLFLWNPNLFIFDFLPDFIGCTLIAVGLLKLRDLTSAMGSALRGFWRLAVLSLSKLIVMTVILALHFEGGYLMVASFVYAIAEGILGISTFVKFFAGLEFVSSHYDNDAILTRLDFFSKLTYIMIVVNAVFGFLPQSLYLQIDEYEGYYLANFRLPFYVLSFLAGCIVGIVWLFNLIDLYRKGMRDSAFCDRLVAEYRQLHQDRPEFYLSRRLRTALMFLGAGLCLMYDFYIDGINTIPDFAASVFLAVGFCLLLPHAKPAKIALGVTALYGIVSAVQFAFCVPLAQKYYDISLRVSAQAYRDFQLCAGLSVAEGVLGLATLGVTLWCLYCVICTYVSHPISGDMESVKLRDKSYRSGFYFRLGLVGVSGALSVISGIANFFCLYLFEEYWVYNMIPAILFILAIISTVSVLREYFSNRYS